MRSQIFHQIVPVRAAALHIKQPVEPLVQLKDLFFLCTLNVHAPERHVLPQLVDIRRGQLFARHAGDLCFQHSAQMAHFFHQLCIDERNIGADLGPDLNEPPLRQLQFCFPEGGAAHPQLFAQFRLVQFFTRLQTGIDNIIDQYPQNKTFCRFILSAL